ncbi:zinc-finger homeodomain protein 6-like [Lotus japonicus]|uniref:zinc-finger homeodomain protein 6-like n=1 Tax=Lotus japonicus TaxID=34305 RepID=UPI002585F353|nr:zinc-finger homeodomain protein 6-like [Lotus japonicus]XP_057449381.1 zinc-finger homeodomain protein 6-like [Lotus japonicus]
MEAVRGQGSKDIEIMSTATTTTLGYNLPIRNSSSSSSKLSSPTAGHRTSTDQPAPVPVPHTNNNTLIFNDSAQPSHHHHHLSAPPLPQTQNHHHQSQRPTTTDPDLTPSSSPLATTRITAPPPPPPTPLVRYRECLRNHAASMGSHVVDGCGEFMPSGEEGTEALKCAACECHRNFHRKEVEGEQQVPNPSFHSYYKHSNGHLQLPAPQPLPPPQNSSLRFSHAAAGTTPTAGPVPVPPLMMAFGGAAAESSSEDLNMFQRNAGAQEAAALSRKRHRTKFSSQQKDRMMEFAEKIGWRIQKQDEEEVQQFCSQVGVRRKVFKVWMHNNKQAMKKLHQM